jgi:hypothetical protein
MINHSIKIKMIVQYEYAFASLYNDDEITV